MASSYFAFSDVDSEAARFLLGARTAEASHVSEKFGQADMNVVCLSPGIPTQHKKAESGQTFYTCNFVAALFGPPGGYPNFRHDATYPKPLVASDASGIVLKEDGELAEIPVYEKPPKNAGGGGTDVSSASSLSAAAAAAGGLAPPAAPAAAKAKKRSAARVPVDKLLMRMGTPVNCTCSLELEVRQGHMYTLTISGATQSTYMGVKRVELNVSKIRGYGGVDFNDAPNTNNRPASEAKFFALFLAMAAQGNKTPVPIVRTLHAPPSLTAAAAAAAAAAVIMPAQQEVSDSQMFLRSLPPMAQEVALGPHVVPLNKPPGCVVDHLCARARPVAIWGRTSIMLSGAPSLTRDRETNTYKLRDSLSYFAPFVHHSPRYDRAVAVEKSVAKCMDLVYVKEDGKPVGVSVTLWREALATFPFCDDRVGSKFGSASTLLTFISGAPGVVIGYMGAHSADLSYCVSSCAINKDRTAAPVPGEGPAVFSTHMALFNKGVLLTALGVRRLLEEQAKRDPLRFNVDMGKIRARYLLSDPKKRAKDNPLESLTDRSTGRQQVQSVFESLMDFSGVSGDPAKPETELERDYMFVVLFPYGVATKDDYVDDKGQRIVTDALRFVRHLHAKGGLAAVCSTMDQIALRFLTEQPLPVIDGFDTAAIWAMPDEDTKPWLTPFAVDKQWVKDARLDICVCNNEAHLARQALAEAYPPRPEYTPEEFAAQFVNKPPPHITFVPDFSNGAAPAAPEQKQQAGAAVAAVTVAASAAAATVAAAVVATTADQKKRGPDGAHKSEEPKRVRTAEPNNAAIL